MAKKKTKTKKLKIVKCDDCGNDYEFGMPHSAFCPARTCDVCGETKGYVVKIQNRADTGKTQVCEDCVINGL